MPHGKNPYLPSDRAADKQVGTNISQRESRQKMNQQRAELERRAKNQQMQKATQIEAANEGGEGEA